MKRVSKKTEQVLKLNPALANASKDLDTILKTPSGRRFFGYMCRTMGFYAPSTVIRKDGNGISKSMTDHNDAVRGCYLGLRNLATPELLAPVELEADKAHRTAQRLLDADNTGKGE